MKSNLRNSAVSYRHEFQSTYFSETPLFTEIQLVCLQEQLKYWPPQLSLLEKSNQLFILPILFNAMWFGLPCQSSLRSTSAKSALNQFSKKFCERFLFLWASFGFLDFLRILKTSQNLNCFSGRKTFQNVLAQSTCLEGFALHTDWIFLGKASFSQNSMHFRSPSESDVLIESFESLILKYAN